MSDLDFVDTYRTEDGKIFLISVSVEGHNRRIHVANFDGSTRVERPTEFVTDHDISAVKEGRAVIFQDPDKETYVATLVRSPLRVSVWNTISGKKNILQINQGFVEHCEIMSCTLEPFLHHAKPLIAAFIMKKDMDDWSVDCILMDPGLTNIRIIQRMQIPCKACSWCVIDGCPILWTTEDGVNIKSINIQTREPYKDDFSSRGDGFVTTYISTCKELLITAARHDNGAMRVVIYDFRTMAIKSELVYDSTALCSIGVTTNHLCVDLYDPTNEVLIQRVYNPANTHAHIYEHKCFHRHMPVCDGKSYTLLMLSEESFIVIATDDMVTETISDMKISTLYSTFEYEGKLYVVGEIDSDEHPVQIGRLIPTVCHP